MPFRFSSFRLAIWRDAKTNNARRKDEITKCTTRNDGNEREKTEKKTAARNNGILNSYFSSSRLASFRYFIFSPGVISSFRNLARRFVVISCFHLALFRLFARP